MENYYQLSDDFIIMFQNIWNTFYIPAEVKYTLVGNNKLKSACKITKLNDLNRHLLDKEIVIEINEEYVYKLEEKISTILITQELTKLAFDLEKNKVFFTQPDVITYASILDKFGTQDVINANQILKQLISQEEDAKKEAHLNKKQKRGRRKKQQIEMRDELFH